MNTKSLLLTAFTLLFSVFANATTFWDGDFYFEVISEDEATVFLRYWDDSSGDTKVTIPSYASRVGKKYKVVSMRNAFNRSNVISVTLPNTMKTIGAYSFYKCASLKEIEIPKSVALIDSSAFSNCTSLKEIVIPDNVKTIGEYAFSECSALEKIQLSKSLTDINESTFALCTSLKEIVIPDGVKTIGAWAFFNCSRLSDLTLGSSVTNICKYAFRACSKLTNLTLRSNEMIVLGKYVFYESNSIKKVVFDSELVTSFCAEIGTLKEVHFSDKVKLVSPGAFRKCESLESVYITDLTKWCDIVFGNVYSNPMCHAKHIYLNGTELTRVIIDEAIEKINSYAFCNIKTLESIELPSTITEIGNNAFSGSSLSSIELPAGLKVLQEGVFASCENLVAIEIPENVEVIEDYAFNGCSNLESITIPSSVTTIGNDVFAKCTSLKEVVIESSDKPLTLGYNPIASNTYAKGNGLFYDCPLETLHLGRNLLYSTATSAGISPFYNQQKLATITFGSDVTDAHYELFRDTKWWSDRPNGAVYVGVVLVGYKGNVPETIVVKDGTVKIADNAFGECSHFRSVKKISVPKSLKEIGIVDFSSTIWYDNLPEGPIYLGNILLTYKGTTPDNTSFTVKDGTTQIRTDFFYYNSGLSAISIPNTVERVDHISKCTNLKELVLPSGVKYFGGITSCPNLKKLVIPNTVTSIGECSGLNGTTVYLDCNLNKAAYYDLYSLGGGVISSGSGMFVKSVSQTSEGSISGDDVRVVLGNNVTIVDKLREGVSSVEIPEGVKIINLDAIKSSQLKSITIPSTITHIGAINNSELQYLTIRDINSWCKIDFNSSKSNSLKNATVFLNREELTHLEIPKGVITISDYAFSNCKTIKRITLPVGIVSLGKGTFNGCENVREIYVHEAVPPTVYDDASGGFPNVCKTATLYVPIGSKAAYEADKTWSVFTNIIEKNFSNFELTPPSSTALFETVYLEDWCSTNISTSSRSSKTYTFKADAGCVLEFDWYVSCEDGDLYSGDALNVELDASTILIDKGNKSGKYRCTILKEGTYTLKTIYKTNSGTIGGADAAMVYNIKISKPDVTHIENIPIDKGYKGLPNVYYDLSGRQVNNPQKGIYIVNGKKVFIK